MLAAHVGIAFGTLVVHAKPEPHPPQLFGSLVKSTQAPLQSV